MKPSPRRLSLLHRFHRGEGGYALITVIGLMMVMSLLTLVMLNNIQSELNGVGRQKNVTSARAAADAGVDRLVYALQQSTSGTGNWSYYQQQYNTSGGAWWGNAATGGWWVIGGGRYRAHVDCDQLDCTNGDANQRTVTVQGEYPVGSGVIRTVTATLRQQAPASFNFAMFADRGIDIHHHGSSYITPTVITPSVHSNGYIKLDYSSSFHVDRIEAGTSIDIGAGGTREPPGGYNWAYWIPGGDANNPSRCYPSKVFPPLDYTSTTWNFPDGAHTCPASPKWSPNAQVLGNVFANQVTVETFGDTTQANTATNCSGTSIPGVNDPITGVCIPTRPGNIDAGIVTVGGRTYTGGTTGNAIVTHFKSGTTPAPCTVGTTCVADCTACNQGTTDNGSAAGGVLNIHPSTWAPGAIDFPSLNYRTTYYPAALAQQGNSTTCNSGGAGATTCHIFPTTNGKDFLSYLADKTDVLNVGGAAYSANPNPCTNCVTYVGSDLKYTTDQTHAVYVIAHGTYFVTGASLNFNYATLKTLFASAAPSPPVIMIQGALIVETGGITLNSSLTVVGPNMNPFTPTATGLPASTVPGLLAAGNSINASDYDSDSAWTASGQYEKDKRNATTVRGLVYSASWSSTLKRSVASDQHWHNYDPKNLDTIIGAQVGGKLHDCNNFAFSYDPLIQNLLGFTSGGGSIYVVGWQET